MLYASTRSKVETYTAQRTLWTERASDGGLYVPMQIPQFKRTEILHMKNNTPEENLALILNKFFQTGFTGKEVEYAVGRRYYQIVKLRHKTMLAELWHNHEGSLDSVLCTLIRRVSPELRSAEPGEWPRVVIRIAMLFTIYCDLFRQGEISMLHPMDLAVPVGDYRWPMAAWYARKMGLPIGTVICCCTENEGIRELLHRGQIRLDNTVLSTITPNCDSTVPAGLERAIFTMLGREETAEFLRIQEKNGVYAVNPEQKRLLSEGMYVAVNSSKRLREMIPNAYRTFNHVLCPYGVMVYTGVMDYQSVTGKYNKVLMVCDDSPEKSQDVIAEAMGISRTELKQRLNLEQGI